MTIVFFVRSLYARNANLVSVDDDNEVARINMRGVLRLMLTLQDVSSLGSYATKHLVLCINENPLALNFVGLCVISLHSVPPIK